LEIDSLRSWYSKKFMMESPIEKLVS
jgi:hypothetical protein